MWCETVKKKSALRILLEFVVVTVPLTWFWMTYGEAAYEDFFRAVGFPILLQLGVTGFPMGVVTDRMISFIPFLALMVVTPKMTRARRIGGIIGGFFVLFLSHIGLALWAWISFVRDGRSDESMLTYFPALVIADALPFLLWAIFANRYLKELLERVLPPPPVAGD